MTAGYDDHATARFAAEPPKQDGTEDRGPFRRDRARVLHSSALRRLAAKTQVVAVGSADFPRTRLTHSLECAQIGRELGEALGCDPDLVDAACLAHDLGHPPFGHNGEAVLAVIAARCGGFEGNAQSLRLLTRLEAKVPGAGLNLTRATLDATLKYPWLGLASRTGSATQGTPARPRGGTGTGTGAGSGCGKGRGNATGNDSDAGKAAGASPAGAAAAKFGCYAEDAAAFGWIRDGATPSRPCLEAQVMDWADDVAYSVHDLEDGLHSGLIRLRQLRDRGEQRVVAELASRQYCAPGSVSTDELADAFAGLVELDCWPASFDGGPASSAAVKNLTSELIGRFCEAAQHATRPAGAPALARHGADLGVPRAQRLECAVLKAVTAHYVMSRAGAAAAQARERELIAELAAVLADRAPDVLDPMFRPAYLASATDAGRLRVIVDQIAALTDTSAAAWHARLCVAKAPSRGRSV